MKKRQAFFNQAAENWDKEHYNPKLQLFLKQFVQSFEIITGSHLLDVGTGTGVLIPHLLQVVGPEGDITAIDYAQSMVNICRTKYSHLPNVSIAIGSVEKLPFSDNFFNTITCFGLFPHLDDKKNVLNEFHRVLQTKGKLIIAHTLSSKELDDMHKDTNPAIGNDMLPNENEMRKLLNQANFAGIRINDSKGKYLCISTKTKSVSVS